MTSRNRVAGVLLRYTVDKRSAREADQANKQQLRSIDKLTRESKALSRTNVDKTLSANAKAANDVAKAYDRAADNAARLTKSQERFDATSRNVSLAGDAQSNLGALSGLAGVAGLGGADRGISTIGETFALIEELPRLKEALVGLPQTIGASVTALGPVGLGLTAVIAALGVSAAIAAKPILEAKRAFEDSVSALGEFNQFKINATTEDATAQLKTYQDQLQSSTETLTALKAAGESVDGPLAAIVKKFGGYEAAVKALEQEQAGAQRRVELYTGAIADGTFAINDAAAAQAEYNDRLQEFTSIGVNSRVSAKTFLNQDSTTSEDVDKRLSGLGAELRAISDTLRNDTSLLDKDREALEKRQAALTAEYNALVQGREAVDRRTIANEALAESEKAAADAAQAHEAILKIVNRERLSSINQAAAAEKEYARLSRDATTSQVADRIQALQDERTGYEELIAQLEPIAGDSEEFALALAKARQDLQRVNGDIERTFGEVAPAAVVRLRESINEELSKASITRNDSITKAGATRSEGLQEAAADLEKGLADLDREFAKSQANFRTETQKELESFQRDEIKRVKDHNAELARIQRDSQDSIQDAALRLDASGVRSAQRQRDRATEDANARFEVENEESQQRLELIKVQAEEEKRALIDKYREQRQNLLNANREQVDALNQKYRAEVQSANSAYRTQVDLLNQKLRAETQLIQQAYQAQLQAAQQFAQQSAQLARQAAIDAGKQRISNVTTSVASTGIGSTLSKIFGGFGIFDNGGQVDRYMLGAFKPGETFLNAQQGNALTQALKGIGGGERNTNFAPNIVVQGNLDNVTLKDVERQLNLAFDEFMRM